MRECKQYRNGIRVTLAASSKINLDQIRIKKGEAVILSKTDPLHDRVCDATVRDLTSTIIAIEIPKDKAEPANIAGGWRLDKFANTLTYKRQLDSLVELCSKREQHTRPAIFELISCADVGDIDSWAERSSHSHSTSNYEAKTTVLEPTSSKDPTVPTPNKNSAIKNLVQSEAGEVIQGTLVAETQSASVESPERILASEAPDPFEQESGDVDKKVKREPTPLAEHDTTIELSEIGAGKNDGEAAGMAIDELASTAEYLSVQQTELSMEAPTAEFPTAEAPTTEALGDQNSARPTETLKQAAEPSLDALPADRVDGKVSGMAVDNPASISTCLSVQQAELNVEAPTAVALLNIKDATAAETSNQAAEAAPDACPTDGITSIPQEADANLDMFPDLSAGESTVRNSAASAIGEHIVAKRHAALTAGMDGTRGKTVAEVLSPSSARMIALASEKLVDGIPQERISSCLEAVAVNSKLNPSQKAAVCDAMLQRCTLIQGPPGTGKTTAAVQILKAWVGMGLKPALATADGNTAVDNIAEGLAKAGVKVVRVGRAGKISTFMEAYSLDNLEKKEIERRKAEAAQAAERQNEAARASRDANISAACQAFKAELEGKSEAEIETAAAMAGMIVENADRYELSRCSSRPDANGTYIAKPAAAQSTSHRPKKTKSEGRRQYTRDPAAVGAAEDSAPMLCFYKKVKSLGRTGWWLAPKPAKLTKEKEFVGFNPSTSMTPPSSGWRFRSEADGSNEESADTAATLTPTSMPRNVIVDWLVNRRRTELEKQLASDGDGVGDASTTNYKKVRADPETLRREQLAEAMEIRQDILRNAEVICAQMISAGGPFLGKLGKFEAILVDEVAQATEPGVLVPIVQRSCNRLALVGDHCQLPPTVQSREAELRGLTLSLYGRLVRQGLSPTFLDTQFRSHPKLMEFVADKIYNGRLKSGTNPADRPAVKGFAWPRPKIPIAFINIDGAESSSDGESKSNEAEAKRLLAVLDSVLSAGDCEPKDIGVVTPYMGQVRLLRKLWHEHCRRVHLQASGGKRKQKGLKSSTGPRLVEADLEIASVRSCNPTNVTEH